MTLKVTKDFSEFMTRNGIPVRIICLDAPGDYPVIIMTKDGKTSGREIGGFVDRGNFPAHQCDIIPANSYIFRENDEVYVRNSILDGWHRRHYASTHSDGTARTFVKGGTRWSSCEKIESWRFCVPANVIEE